MPNTVPVGLSGFQLRQINKLSDREFSINRTKTKKTQFLRKIIDFSEDARRRNLVFGPACVNPHYIK